MKVDKDLLSLYNIHSVSGTDGEKEICDWICKRLDDMGIGYKRIDNTIYRLGEGDVCGLLSAHLDQVQTNGKAEHFYLVDKRYILGYNNKYQRTSLGADDKNGVWIILKLLEQGCNVDFIISESEETGCKGIAKVEEELKKYADEYDYCIVLDRRGNSEVLNRGSTGKYCKALAHNLKNFWEGAYTVGSGSISDTATICKYIESVNLSVAYESAHTSKERTDYIALMQIKEDVRKALEYFTHYPSDPSEYAVKSTDKTYYNRYFRGDYQDGRFY